MIQSRWAQIKLSLSFPQLGVKQGNRKPNPPYGGGLLKTLSVLGAKVSILPFLRLPWGGKGLRPSRFCLLGIFFLVVSSFVFAQPGLAKGGPAATSPGKESPRFFGAKRGALPIVKRSISEGETSLMPAYKALLRAAEEALATTPPTVTDKKQHPVTGKLNDYYTQAPYLWPDPSKSDGLPYLPKDGMINPESRNPDFVDYSRGQEIGHLVETLSLAYYLTDEERYAAHAARCLRVLDSGLSGLVYEQRVWPSGKPDAAKPRHDVRRKSRAHGSRFGQARPGS